MMRIGFGFVLMIFAAAAWGQTSPIVIGMTTPLSGPEAAYGNGLRHGANLVIAQANKSGGVGGRPLQLSVIDDAGNSLRARTNALELIKRGALVLTGVHGALSTVEVSSVLAQFPPSSAPPLIGPATSDESIRTPPRPGVFFLRAGTADEAGAAMLHLDTLGIQRYAVIAQTSPLGSSGLDSVVAELMRIATKPVSIERVPTAAQNSEIEGATKRACLGSPPPQALILAMDAVLAEAVAVAAGKVSCRAMFVLFSEAGAALARDAQGKPGLHSLAGSLVTQIVPHPSSRRHPLVAEYRQALREVGDSESSYPSLEGYLAMRVILEALRACSRELVPACVQHVMLTRTLEIAGMTFRLGDGQRLQRPFVDVTFFKQDGRFQH